MTVHNTDTRPKPQKTTSNATDKIDAEEETDIKNQTHTVNRIPTDTNLEINNSKQTNLNGRNIKTTAITTKVSSILKSCVEAVISVFCYISDKIASFFTYIISKFLTQDKQDQTTPVIPANDKNSIVAEIPHEDSESPEANKYTKATTDISIQDLATLNDGDKDENPVIENQPATNQESFTEEPDQNIEAFQDSDTSQESKVDEIIIDNKLLSSTVYEPIQEDLDLNKSDTAYQSDSQPLTVNNNKNDQILDDELVITSPPVTTTKKDARKKTQGKGFFGDLKAHLRRAPKKEQKLLDESFHNFFKKYSTNTYDIETLTKMSSCSQEDFNTMFIDKSIYYLKKQTNKKPTPTEVMTFINNKINFVNMVITDTADTNKLLAEKCSSMMQQALGHYIELQINASGNESRSFTASDILLYMRDFADEQLQKVKLSAEKADKAFLIDIVRDDPKIEFFESNKLVWSSSDPESVALTKKLRTCDSELKAIEQHTKESTDKLSESKEIETEITEYRRSQIQKLLNTDDPTVTSFLLKEQSQSGAGSPATLVLAYAQEQLNDAFQYGYPRAALSSDRKFNIEFHKTKDNKITIKAILSGTFKFTTDDIEFKNLCPYEATTEIEYDFENSANNRITKGQIKFFPTEKN